MRHHVSVESCTWHALVVFSYAHRFLRNRNLETDFGAYLVGMCSGASLGVFLGVWRVRGEGSLGVLGGGGRVVGIGG